MILDKGENNGLKFYVKLDIDGIIKKVEYDELTGYTNIITEDEDIEVMSYREVLENVGKD